MQKAWRERNPQARIRAAYQAIELNREWVPRMLVILFNLPSSDVAHPDRFHSWKGPFNKQTFFLNYMINKNKTDRIEKE